MTCSKTFLYIQRLSTGTCPRAIALVLFFIGATTLCAQDIQARWALESDTAVTGQGLALNIEIQGVDSFDPPPLSIPGVDITWQGGSPRNSTSMVSINGKTTTTVRKSFLGSWSLKAPRAGRYHLDALAIDVSGTRIPLGSLDWTVQEARENEAYILRQEINPGTTVIGLEFQYNLVWYIGQSAQNPEFTLPILDATGIELVQDLNASTTAQSRDAVVLDYHGKKLTGLKSSASWQGKQYTTLTFSLRLKAGASRDYDLSGTAVTFQGVVGTRKVRDFFGDIVEEPRYDTLIARAQPEKLVVTDLPSKGKPAVFSGLIGRLELSWTGAGGPYQVGEPIRLTLNLKGVQNKSDLDLDHMVSTALASETYTVVPDQSPAATTAPGNNSSAEPGMSRNFVFRARKSGRLTIPSLALNYYDPEARRYGETRSPPVYLDILGSSSNGSSGDAAAKGDGSNPSAQSARDSQGAESTAGLPVNPPGLASPPYIPGWALLGLPGVFAGVLLGLWGWWLHSVQRARRAWKRRFMELCAPLDAAGGRLALEEGRRRLATMTALLDESGPWIRELQEKGFHTALSTESVLWDEGYFSLRRDQEDWPGRWKKFAATMRVFL